MPNETAYVFGSFEVATELGSTDAERTIYDLPGGPWTKIQSYGGAAALGVVLAGHTAEPRLGGSVAARPDLYGRVVAQVEVGYASGDANPDDNDREAVRLRPEPQGGAHPLRRGDALADGPRVGGGAGSQPRQRLAPGPGDEPPALERRRLRAQYIYPTALYRPRPWLDLKAGAVVAQTTADYVDPYRLAVQGAYLNYTGGDPKRHDLGLELDGGFEARAPLGPGLRLQGGAQGGVLFPGGALAEASGAAMKTPWIVVGRLGLQY